MTVLELPSERLASPPIAVLTAALIVLAVVFKAVYNIFFHPLRSYPGPLLWRASRFPYVVRFMQGKIPYDLKRLHAEYGPVVRIAPDELTYNCSKAWRDIYGRNKQPNGETTLFNKDPILYSAVFADHKALIDSDGDEHRPQKRTLSYAFSHQVLVERGHIITGCIDRMIEGVKAHLGSSPSVSAVVDICPWIENALFDLGGQLTVGRDLNAIMSQGTVHPSLALFKSLFDLVQCYYLQLRRGPGILINAVESMPGFSGYDCVLPVKDVHDMILKRMADEKYAVADENSGDFASYLMSRAKSEGLNDDKVWINCVHLILGTPEAMPSSIISTIYHLLTTPYAYAEAVREVRAAFKSSDEITAQDVQNLPYLLACFRETLRRRPTIPGTLTRQVPPAGAEIASPLSSLPTSVSLSLSLCLFARISNRNPPVRQIRPRRHHRRRQPVRHLSIGLQLPRRRLLSARALARPQTSRVRGRRPRRFQPVRLRPSEVHCEKPCPSHHPDLSRQAALGV